MIHLYPEGCTGLFFFKEDVPYPGVKTDYAVLKRQYVILSNGDLEPSNKDDLDLSENLYFSDEFGESLKSSEDYLPPGRNLNLTIVGAAYTPNGLPVNKLECGFEIGEYSKKINVLGDRKYVKYLDGSSEITEAADFQSMPLRAEFAFGGPDLDAQPYGKGYVYSEHLDPSLSDMHSELQALETLPDEEDVNEPSEPISDMADDFQDIIIFEEISERSDEENVKNIVIDREIEFIVDLPNLELQDDPYKDPNTIIGYAAFSPLPSDWTDKVGNIIEVSEMEALVWELNNPGADVALAPTILDIDDFSEGSLAADTCIYEVAPVDQRFSEIPYGMHLILSNMHPSKERFVLSFPDEFVIGLVSSEENPLEPTDFKMDLDKVHIDLEAMLVECVWKGYYSLKGTDTAQKDVLNPIVSFKFQKLGEYVDLEKLKLDFSEDCLPFKEGMDALKGPSEEDIKQKIADVKRVLTEMGEKAGVPKTELDSLFAPEDPEEIFSRLEDKFKAVVAEIEEKQKAMEEKNAATRRRKGL